MSSAQSRFSLESLCRGCGEEEEKEPHGLHAQELDEVDPDVVDDVHRGEDVPGQDQVTACFHSGTGCGSLGQVFAK